jgi:hypothetical protein
METGDPTQAPGHSAAKGFIGGAIAFYAVFDTLTLGVATTALVIFVFNPLIVFVGAAVGITLLNYACCMWVDREWGDWVTGPGEKVEAKLDRFRSSPVLRHPVDWVTRSSVVWFALAAMLINAIVVTVAARVVGGTPVGARRIRVAAVTYSIFFAGVYTLIGWAATAVL